METLTDIAIAATRESYDSGRYGAMVGNSVIHPGGWFTAQAVRRLAPHLDSDKIIANLEALVASGDIVKGTSEDASNAGTSAFVFRAVVR